MNKSFSSAFPHCCISILETFLAERGPYFDLEISFFRAFSRLYHLNPLLFVASSSDILILDGFPHLLIRF